MWAVDLFLLKFYLRNTWHLLARWIINCWLTTRRMIYLCDITRENIQIRIFKPINWRTPAKNFHNNTFHEKKKNWLKKNDFPGFPHLQPGVQQWRRTGQDGQVQLRLRRRLVVVYMLVSSQCPHISVCHSKAPILPSGTVFDQQTLTCNFPEDAFPCEESPSLYGQVRRAKWSKYFRL